MQVEEPNHLKVLRTKTVVLSVKEKAVLNCQVRIKEMNDHMNLLRKCRKAVRPRQNQNLAGFLG